MAREPDFDVIVVGGSYSGLAAAMALGRALRKVLVIDSGRSCNRQTPHSHNFVTQDGKPVEGAVVTFIPVGVADPTAKAPGGQGQTGADGAYHVHSSFDQGKTMQDGLPAGDYKVTVVKMEAPSGEASFDRPPKNILPAKYAAAESSPVSAKVTAEGPNRVDVSL